MTFIHEPLNFPKLKRTTLDGYRVYETPDGKKYPSITTILSADKQKNVAIAKWKARVGEVEAKRIVKKATIRGTSFHKRIENYLLKGELDIVDPFSLFPQIKPIIDKNITKIHNLEAGVYSNRLKAAGTFDCYAQWQGIPSLIDWKSAKSTRREEWCRTYFYQATFYSLCIGEMLGAEYMPKQIVIVIGVDHETPQLFIKPIKEFIGPVCSSIKAYHLEHK